MRRKLEQYLNSSAKLIAAECSEAHIANWIDDAQSDIAKLHAALKDMLAGWRYIRMHHGDLYGVGWDRCEKAATEILSEAAQTVTGSNQ